MARKGIRSSITTGAKRQAAKPKPEKTTTTPKEAARARHERRKQKGPRGR